MRLPLLIAISLSLTAVNCSGTVVLSGGENSPDGELHMGVVVQIAPGSH